MKQQHSATSATSNDEQRLKTINYNNGDGGDDDDVHVDNDPSQSCTTDNKKLISLRWTNKINSKKKIKVSNDDLLKVVSIHFFVSKLCTRTRIVNA